MERYQDPAELVEILGDWAGTSGPLYRRLAHALARAVRVGDLRPTERLPSERDLAKLLHTSRATVVAAYDELRGSGVVDSRRGSGTRVSRTAPRPRTGADGRVPGGRATSIFQRLVDGPGEVISLSFAVEPAAPELAGITRDLMANDLDGLLAGTGLHPRGYPPLRAAIADHHTAAGLPTAPDQVLVTTGAQQAFGLLTQMYLRPGAVVVVEKPSWPGCLDIFRAAGATLVPVPLDDEGIRVDGLTRVLAEHEPALLYLMPTFHNPTGLLMSAARRRRVAEIAARHQVPVVEDNAYIAVGGDSPVVPPAIAAFAPPGGEVLTVGSLTKAAWGGLRIGWLRGSPEVVERLARYKVRADLAGPLLDQALAAKVLPRLDEIVANRTEVMRGRLEHLRDLLTELLPDWHWRKPDGGSALWVELPGTDARVFGQIALRHGVEIVPGAATDPSGGHDNFLRLPFTLPTDTLTELVWRLHRAWHDVRQPDAAVSLHSAG